MRMYTKKYIYNIIHENQQVKNFNRIHHGITVFY